ncbi:UNVERIFIED_CONTAM: hypothetical protein Slati_4496900 [Sesamum latifolium]|uniref:Uncharacterized protein n=1 Tax=Sesamum latifolium TaxID=2727402 RepID=A0AAW2SSU7_9LAMI
MSRLRRGANEILRANRGPLSPQATCCTASQLPIWECVRTVGAVEFVIMMGASSPPLVALRTALLFWLCRASLCSSAGTGVSLPKIRRPKKE